MPTTRRTFLQSALLLPSALCTSAFAQESTTGTGPFADFEGGAWNGWAIQGDAFGSAPATDALFPGKIHGFGGRGFACSLHPRTGNAAFGKAVSRQFTIEKAFINFRIGGGYFPYGSTGTISGQACLNLVVDGAVVRTETGNGSPQLAARSWDVSEFAGKSAHLEIIDSTRAESRGYILVDEITFDERRNSEFQQWLEGMADGFLQRNGYPGVWISVFSQGREIGSIAAGYADRETKRAASLSDIIWMGSVSKAVVATLFAKAVEMSRVSYDSTLGEITGTEGLPLPVQRITARELLAHTSGLPRDTTFRPSAGDTDFREVRKKAMLTFLAGPVGTQGKQSYSNIGYIALAVLLESKMSRSMEAMVSDLLVAEQGLSSFSSGSKSRAPSAYQTTLDGLTEAKGGMGNYEWAPGGFLRSSIQDLCRFGLIHCGHRYSRKPFLADDRFLAGLHRPCPSSSHSLAAYQVEPHRDGSYLLHHSGLLRGARGDSTVMYVEPKTGLVIAAYTNCRTANVVSAQDKRPSPADKLRTELVNPIYRKIK